jgi:hypothetical protein
VLTLGALSNPCSQPVQAKHFLQHDLVGLQIPVPQGAVVPVFASANSTVKLTYTKAPTWTVCGN